MKKIKFLTVLFLVGLQSSVAFGATLFEDNFDGYADSPENHGWSMGSNVSVSTGKTGRGVKVNYTTEGTGPHVFSRSINYSEAYYSFDFKRVGWNTCGGAKFFKLRAVDSGDWSNYANITTQFIYENGALQQITHGCGAALANDQGCGANLVSSTLWGDGTVLTYSETYNVPDESWHHYEFYVKLNTDNTSDGAYTMWIDGVKKYEATGVRIRNASNLEAFTYLLLGDYGAYSGCDEYSWDLYYDNIVIADKQISIVPPSKLIIE